jgi:hypothetical protein
MDLRLPLGDEMLALFPGLHALICRPGSRLETVTADEPEQFSVLRD